MDQEQQRDYAEEEYNRQESRAEGVRESGLFAVHIRAANDHSGNPRRGWFIIDPYSSGDTHVVAFVNEMFGGRRELELHFPGIPEVLTLTVPATEYETAMVSYKVY